MNISNYLTKSKYTIRFNIGVNTLFPDAVVLGKIATS